MAIFGNHHLSPAIFPRHICLSVAAIKSARVSGNTSGPLLDHCSDVGACLSNRVVLTVGGQEWRCSWKGLVVTIFLEQGYKGRLGWKTTCRDLTQDEGNLGRSGVQERRR